MRIRPAAPAAPPALAAPAASGNLGFRPLGIEVEKHGFRTACLITGQKFQGVGLRLTAFILTFRDPSSLLCQKNIRAAVLTDLELGSCSSESRIWNFQTPFFLVVHWLLFNLFGTPASPSCNSNIYCCKPLLRTTWRFGQQAFFNTLLAAKFKVCTDELTITDILCQA